MILLVKKLTMAQKEVKLKKILIMIKVISITTKNVAARLKQAYLAPKADTDVLVEKTDFDDKSKNLNNKIISSKTKCRR